MNLRGIDHYYNYESQPLLLFIVEPVKGLSQIVVITFTEKIIIIIVQKISLDMLWTHLSANHGCYNKKLIRN